MEKYFKMSSAVNFTQSAKPYGKTGFDIPYKLSPMETICMKCLILFSGGGKKRKYFKMSSAVNFTQSAKALWENRI